jgi:NAD(P)-dependent dehydrogenase (short-subunit alcohol dehydrogenase family)
MTHQAEGPSDEPDLDQDVAGMGAVVVGEGGGVAASVARRLAREAAKVVLIDGDADVGGRTVDEISQTGAQASFMGADLTHGSEVARVVSKAATALGRLDILVNVPGGYDEPYFPDASVEHWSRTVKRSFDAVMFATQAAICEMRGHRGAIVNVSSSAGLGYAPHVCPEYAAAAAGVARFTASLGHLAAEGIRVNCICSDTVATAAVEKRIHGLEAAGQDLPPDLAGPLIDPERICDWVLGFVRNGTLAGKVLLCWAERPWYLLPPDW